MSELDVAPTWADNSKKQTPRLISLSTIKRFTRPLSSIYLEQPERSWARRVVAMSKPLAHMQPFGSEAGKKSTSRDASELSSRRAQVLAQRH